MTMNASGDISVIVSRTMDAIGYSHDMVKFRQAAWERMPIKRKRNHCNDVDFVLILAGSKPEGLTKLFESDIDCMSITLDTICTNNPVQFIHRGDLSVFQLETNETAPGYTRLKLTQLSNNCNNTSTAKVLNESLTEPYDGHIYLSSARWAQYHMEERREYSRDIGIHVHEMFNQGPACSVNGSFGNRYHQRIKQLIAGDTDNTPYQELLNRLLLKHPNTQQMDTVKALICDYSDKLESWFNRERFHQWPNHQVREEISFTETSAVPIGSKESPFQFLEWRISYVMAEMKLIHSLNDCQIKLLILLKNIAKNALKPICKDMTSYIMKNVVLWMAEIFPEECFQETNLQLALQAALQFLKRCLKKNNIPSYMIQEKNLLSGRVSLRKRSRLCMKIDLLQREGPYVFLRSEKMRHALTLLNNSPQLLSFYSHQTHQLEIVTMCLVTYMLPLLNALQKHEIVEYISQHEQDIFLTILQAGLPFLSKILNSMVHMLGDVGVENVIKWYNFLLT